MLTALMHITSSQPHACSSHTELVLYLQRSLCFIQKQNKIQSFFFVFMRQSGLLWGRRCSSLPSETRQNSSRSLQIFFSSGHWTWSLWLPAVCVSSASVADTQRGSDQCVKCKKYSSWLILSCIQPLRRFFFFLSFLSFSETGVWKSSCRGQNKICDFSVTRLISSSISLFYEEMFVFLNRC